MKRSILCTCVLLILCGSFFLGCKKGDSPQAAAPAGGYGPRVEGLNYWLAKYPQTMTIHTVNKENPQATSQMNAGDTMVSNQWTRGLKEYLNIDVVTDWVASQADYTTKLNLSIASDSIPDMFQASPVQFRQLLEADLIADLTDYVPNNLSDHVKEIMAFDTAVTESAKRNGRLYGIPVYGYGPIDDFPLLALRHDWMQGKAAPVTVADLEKLMDGFIKDHPGTYGTALNKNLTEFYNFAPAFKAYPNAWLKQGNSIVYGRVQPEMKQLLQTFADWYKKGYLLKDFMAQDDTAIRQDIVSGKTGVHVFAQWWGYAYGADVVKNLGPNAYSDAYALPTVDGSKPVFSAPFENDNYLVINKKYKTPDVGLKSTTFISWVNDSALAEGLMTNDVMLTYVFPNSEGQHIMKQFEIANVLGEVLNYNQIQNAKKTGKTDGMTGTAYSKYVSANEFETNKDGAGFGNWYQDYADRSAYGVNLEIINEKRYFSTELLGPNPEEMDSYGSTLDDLLTEGFTQIIVGTRPVSYFDDLVTQWKAAGGDVATAAVNKIYGKK